MDHYDYFNTNTTNAIGPKIAKLSSYFCWFLFLVYAILSIAFFGNGLSNNGQAPVFYGLPFKSIHGTFLVLIISNILMPLPLLLSIIFRHGRGLQFMVMNIFLECLMILTSIILTFFYILPIYFPEVREWIDFLLWILESIREFIYYL